MESENQDIDGDKCIKDDDGNLGLDDKSKLAAWKSHYEKLFLMLSSPGAVAPCLKSNHAKVLLLGLPPRWLPKHWQR